MLHNINSKNSIETCHRIKRIWKLYLCSDFFSIKQDIYKFHWLNFFLKTINYQKYRQKILLVNLKTKFSSRQNGGVFLKMFSASLHLTDTLRARFELILLPRCQFFLHFYRCIYPIIPIKNPPVAQHKNPDKKNVIEIYDLWSCFWCVVCMFGEFYWQLSIKWKWGNSLWNPNKFIQFTIASSTFAWIVR